MAVTTRPYDSARYLGSPEAIDAYLADALEDGDPKAVAHALGVIARAHGMTRLAQETGLTRESLYRALSGEGNPEFATILKVAAALGLRLTMTQVAGPEPKPRRRSAARKAA